MDLQLVQEAPLITQRDHLMKLFEEVCQKHIVWEHQLHDHVFFGHYEGRLGIDVVQFEAR